MLTRREYSARRRIEALALVQAAKQQPCLDCKRRYPPWCMDFDHVHGDKVDSLGHLVSTGASLARLIDEMAKCEVVCANCHRNRTHERRKAAGELVAEA